VLNLYRLHIDDYGSLPEPPIYSVFHQAWRSQSRRRIDETPRAEGLYRKKFEGLFGTVSSRDGVAFSAFRAENLWPVAMATIVISVGWVLTIRPEAIFNVTFVSADTVPSGRPTAPLEAIRFAFMGAYFYVLQMLVRRYFQNDLKTSAYVNATVRVVIVILLVWVLDVVWNDPATEGQRLAVAFVIGVFPQLGLQVLIALIKWPLKVVVPSLSQRFPLSDLDGLNVWYESRLLEEGIEDMQNLATANLVDVMLNTRIPTERLVDWVDQSLLYLHLDHQNGNGGESDRDKLRRFGIRCATDLEDVFIVGDETSEPGASPSAKSEFVQKFQRVLNENESEPSVLLAVLASLKHEPNLFHVREWKTFAERKLVES
jgi:hypothetical protein